MIEDNMIKILIRERMNHFLEQELKENAEHQEVEERVKEKYSLLEQMKLNSEQFLAIDRVISTTNEAADINLRLSYQKGFNDCLKLFSDVRQAIEIPFDH